MTTKVAILFAASFSTKLAAVYIGALAAAPHAAPTLPTGSG
ncbi:MAG: hypothetical protein Q8L55_15870 [Phycisphaerales bacterium]|nr:hypothetical protein [Phycisphaerales bacterium]